MNNCLSQMSRGAGGVEENQGVAELPIVGSADARQDSWRRKLRIVSNEVQFTTNDHDGNKV